MNTFAFMRLRAGERAHASNEDLAFVTNRLHALQDENAVLRRQAADLTRHNESLRMRKMLSAPRPVAQPSQRGQMQQAREAVSS
jgi:hypothetical protein